jgi:calpain-15
MPPDDYFPCDPATGQPAFTHCRGPELWVVILEKAWAKVHGSYQNIEGGSAPDVLSALTGAPG